MGVFHKQEGLELFKLKVSKIIFAGGQTINTHDADVIIIVGPNNSGKSRTLQEIGDTIEQSSHDKLVIETVELRTEGHYSDLIDWLSAYYPQSNDGASVVIKRSGSKIDQIVVMGQENHLKKHVGLLREKRRLSYRMVDGQWVQQGHQANSIDFFEIPFSHPIHLMQRSPEIKQRVSQAVYDAFGFHITPELPFSSGNCGLKKGQEPENIVNKYTFEYKKAIESLPSIHREGSGVRGYIGCLQHTIIGQYKIVLIDEPELFLHPPQAKRLGEVIAKYARINGQQIIAVTHSSDFVIGAVTGSDNVCIIRIDRDDDTNYVNSVNPTDLVELWNDPLLKSARAVRGLFHEGVIVCEGDTDIRFYESILRRLEGKRNVPSDIHFVHGGGKDKIDFLVNAYKKLNVPVVAISDFDLLRTTNKLESVYESLEGNFSDIRGKYNSAKEVLSKAGSVKTPLEALGEIEQLVIKLKDKVSNNGSISGGDAEKIKISKLMEDARDWSNAKKFGLHSVKSGAKKSVKDLLVELEDVGLFIVNYGELESWNTDIEYNGKTDWVNQALELIKDDLATFVEAEKFIEKVITKLSSQLSLE